jgi:hypothetical protein
MPTLQSKTGQQSTIDLTFINMAALSNVIIENGKSITQSHSPPTTSPSHGTSTKENNTQMTSL